MSRSLGFLLVGLLATATARAEAATPLSYRAPAGCPGQQEFRAELERSLAGSARSIDALGFDIAIVAEAEGYRGTLRTAAREPAEPVREVVDTSCREVVQALAFIAAVLVDPEVAEHAGVLGEAPAAPEAPASEESATETAEPAPRTTRPATSPRPKQPRRSPTRSAATRETPAAPEDLSTGTATGSAWAAAVTAGATAESALAPGLRLGPRLGLWLEHGRFGAGASATFGSSGEITSDGGAAELDWLRGRLEGCAGALASRGVSLHACALFDAGFIDGAGRRAPLTETRRSAWVAPGLLGRGVLRFGRVLGASAELGGFAPLVRPRFLAVAPDGGERVVYQTPSVGFFAGIGLVAYFL